jgi:hypothetical protein
MLREIHLPHKAILSLQGQSLRRVSERYVERLLTLDNAPILVNERRVERVGFGEMTARGR